MLWTLIEVALEGSWFLAKSVWRTGWWALRGTETDQQRLKRMEMELHQIHRMLEAPK